MTTKMISEETLRPQVLFFKQKTAYDIFPA